MHFLITPLVFLPFTFAVPHAGALDIHAPLLTAKADRVLPGKYIIKLRQGTTEDALNGALARLNKTDYVYRAGSFKGFAGRLEGGLLDEIRSLPDVEYVEEDAIVTVDNYISQGGAPWGLARISHRAKGSTTYVYDDSAGAGTCAYVIDTGIYTAHSQFGGRATFAANFVDNSNTDGHGHGTHVAGTIGSDAYGVAKKTDLYAVKVLGSDGSGTTSGVIAGINFVADDAPRRSCPNGTVANMSLGGSYSASINQAAAALVRSGVFLAVAAGNDDMDARFTSPASEPTVCTVGATDRTDAKASYSNYGPAVDIFAPGTNILSTWIGSTTATNTISGTSMATPHVTGLGAYLLALLGRKDPKALCSYIQSIADSNVITGMPMNTVNKLAFNGNPSA